MKTTRFLAGLPLENVILAKDATIPNQGRRRRIPQPRQPRDRTARPVAGRLLAASPPTNKKAQVAGSACAFVLEFRERFSCLICPGKLPRHLWHRPHVRTHSWESPSTLVRKLISLGKVAHACGRLPAPAGAPHLGRLSPRAYAYPCLRSKSTLLVCSQLSTVPVSKPSSGSTTSAYISSSRSTSSSASVS